MNYVSRDILKVDDWDNLVKSTYEKHYNFQQQDNCRNKGVVELDVPSKSHDFENDTIPEIVDHPCKGVSFKAWLAKDPKQPIENQKYADDHEIWWERNFYPDYQMIANDLHSKGLLPEGNYLIHIDW